MSRCLDPKSKCDGTIEDHRMIALDVRELIRKHVFEQPVGSLFILGQVERTLTGSDRADLGIGKSFSLCDHLVAVDLVDRREAGAREQDHGFARERRQSRVSVLLRLRGALGHGCAGGARCRT